MDLLFQQIALIGDIWVFWILVGLSILGGAVFFERLNLLRSEARLARTNTGRSENSESGEPATPGTLGATARIIAGLDEHSRGGSEVAVLEQILQSFLLSERRTFERRLAILGTIGSNAPFIGLLGTVLGVIQAFHDLSLTGEGGTGVVMAGIASALVITAAGLVVAIPAVIANNYFRTMIEDILACAEAGGRLRLAALAARRSTDAVSPR